MNSSDQLVMFGTRPPAGGELPVQISLRGITIPSFKNNKMLIVKSPSGKPLERPLLITKPEFQKQMAAIVDAIVSQCLSAFQTAAGPTCQESSIRCLIASSLPADDCWELIPEIAIKGELCEPGNEGAEILIERL